MAPLPLGFIPAAIALVLWSCAPWQCLLAAYVSDNTDALLSEHKRILTAFKQDIVGDPKGALASWRASRDVCSWRGVACAAGGGGKSTVVGLELPGERLSGTLTPMLFSMPFLTHLNLSSNSFKGSFPDVRNGSSLVSLDLSSNLLSGTLPDSIGTLSSLEVLSLGSNDLWGPIPSALGRCNKLAYLELDMASDGQSPSVLNGTIPDTWQTVLPSPSCACLMLT